MDNFQEEVVKEVLRSELGKNAHYRLYDRNLRSPMNFMLDEVEREIGPRFSVYWVDGGLPEVFTLPSFSPSPVIFSTRYLSLTAVIRQLFTNNALKDVLVGIAERVTLKAMAEMALRHGDPDYAVLAFVKSTMVDSTWLIDGNDAATVMELELAPMQEAYMATWFYGLLHELGHLSPLQMEPIPDDHPFSDSKISRMITRALEYFRYPEFIEHEAIERTKQSNSILRIDQIRSEGLADLFAANILFKTTFNIMRENQEQFNVVHFIEEMVIFLPLIAIIDRCRRVASIASATTTHPEAHFEMALHPISITVRAMMLRTYLESAITHYLFNTDDPTLKQCQQVEEMLDEINKHYQQQADLIETGHARAMEFSLFPERRENDWALLEEFRQRLLSTVSGALSIVETEQFCRLADSLEVDSKLLRALNGIVYHPSEPIRPDATGDFGYFVPWVEGPNGFNQPFGLDTKYGHLVFVFHIQSGLYKPFCKVSAETLQSGYTLKDYVVLAPRKERLRPELAPYMPEGQVFQVVVEGTKTFELYIEELANDTIWED